MKKLTIVFTTTHADTIGNACRIDMVEFLTKHFDSTIITSKQDFIRLRFPKTKIIPLNINNKYKLPIVNNYKFQISLAKEINEVTSDGVFLFHNDAISAIWIKYPVYQYIHQYGRRVKDKSKSAKNFLKRIVSKFNHKFTLKGLKKSEINFVVSKFLIEYFQNEGLNNLEFTPHAMDIEKYRNPSFKAEHGRIKLLKGNGNFIVTYAGSVTKNRGFQLMMDSIKEVASKDKKIILVIAGADEEFSQRITDFLKNNNLENNVFNYGVIDSSLIPGILYYSDVCLSFWDADVPGFQLAPPQKIFEYFAAGKPIICNQVQTHSMFVEDGKTGFVLDMDYKQVSQTILSLKNNPELLKSMSENAGKEAEKYDIHKVYGAMVKKINKRIDELQKNN